MSQPTGIMNLKVDGVSTDNCTINGDGTFSITESSAPASGPHAFSFHYNGDPLHDPADSSPLNEQVAPPPPRTVVISNLVITPAPPIQGQPYTITGTITQGS